MAASVVMRLALIGRPGPPGSWSRPASLRVSRLSVESLVAHLLDDAAMSLVTLPSSVVGWFGDVVCSSAGHFRQTLRNDEPRGSLHQREVRKGLREVAQVSAGRDVEFLRIQP